MCHCLSRAATAQQATDSIPSLFLSLKNQQVQIQLPLICLPVSWLHRDVTPTTFPSPTELPTSATHMQKVGAGCSLELPFTSRDRGLSPHQPVHGNLPGKGLRCRRTGEVTPSGDSLSPGVFLDLRELSVIAHRVYT